MDGEIFNVCTGSPTSISELVEALHGVVKQDLRVNHASPRTGEIKFSYGDPSKATEKLKFTAKVSLHEGLTLLLKSTT